MIISGWGRFPRAKCRVIAPRRESDVLQAIAQSPSLIARGAGRAYGDSSLNTGATLLMEGCDRFLDFDEATGLLTCEAGVLLADIVRVFSPRGWFPTVTPGTQFVTIGGMIAADVHGKNHHQVGGFGAHVEWLDLGLASGDVLRCSRGESADLFWATIGGMGLTGVILRASIRLRPIETMFLRQRVVLARNLDAVIAAIEENAAFSYSAAWIDCLASKARIGRSVLFLGEHAKADEIPIGLGVRTRASLRVPVDFPSFMLNRLSVRLFNSAYYARARAGESVVDIQSFFYPLDSVREWNRIYGRAGFLQYQCVLPKQTSAAGLRQLLTRIAQHGAGSFLAVLKLLGAGSGGLLSFPMEGYTLALDFPASRSNLDLLCELDAIVTDHGGRLYLAKDARASAAVMARGYPRLEQFQTLRARFDPQRRFASMQSERLAI